MFMVFWILLIFQVQLYFFKKNNPLNPIRPYTLFCTHFNVKFFSKKNNKIKLIPSRKACSARNAKLRTDW